MEDYLEDSDWNFRRKQWQKTENYKTKKLELSLVVRKNSNRTQVAEYIRKNLEDQGIIIDVIEA